MLGPKVSNKKVEDSVYPALLSWKDDWELYPLACDVLKTGVGGRGDSGLRSRGWGSQPPPTSWPLAGSTGRPFQHVQAL